MAALISSSWARHSAIDLVLWEIFLISLPFIIAKTHGRTLSGLFLSLLLVLSKYSLLPLLGNSLADGVLVDEAELLAGRLFEDVLVRDGDDVADELLTIL